ncbi:auxin-responsive protein IAA29-like [Benincasa hispida]|uniref:auxin-responsive protein IAA29-like n=1 Tax=Benincasa hispida TaxID=102211 RepID=UPI00190084E5|nr:auxin-responsive protein IAA29-like [Benincasa hispida]
MAMELQLGLALTPTNPIKPFDLNTHHNNPHNPLCFDFDSITHKKRSRDFNHSAAFRRTLPLLLWNDHPNDGDDDDSNDPHSASSNDSDEEEERENGLVGWPPLKKRRKSLFMKKHVGRAAVIRRPMVENGGGFYRGLNSNYSRYVKVKMEGVGIARKVDLSQHHSFDALRATLMNMFDETDSDDYRLTYQNIDGDWLLAENVTWRNFIGIVQRMKLEKKSG